jgi:hypothetical protein
MTKEEIMRMAEASGVEDSLLYEHWRCNLESMTRFAALVASAEREKLEGQINTLLTLCELAIKQRDELMMQQRADLDAAIQARRKDDKA